MVKCFGACKLLEIIAGQLIEIIFWKSRRCVLIVDYRQILAGPIEFLYCMPLHCNWFLMTKPYILQAPIDFRSFLTSFHISKPDFPSFLLSSLPSIFRGELGCEHVGFDLQILDSRTFDLTK